MTIDQQVALFASIGACLSAIAAFGTLVEISRQRRTSYRPELVISSLNFQASKNPLAASNLPLVWLPFPQDRNTVCDLNFHLPINNIGLGAARDVRVIWNFPFSDFVDDIVQLCSAELNDVNISFDNDILTFIIDESPQFSSMWCNQKTTNFEYILPSSIHKDPTKLMIPPAFIAIVGIMIFVNSALKNKPSIPEIPGLEVTFEYRDISNEKFVKKFKLMPDLMMLSLDGAFYSGVMKVSQV